MSNLQIKGLMWPSPVLWPPPYPTPHGGNSSPSSSPAQLSNSQTINVAWAEIKKRGEHSEVLMQIMANNFVHFDILANHCPMNSKKYAA